MQIFKKQVINSIILLAFSLMIGCSVSSKRTVDVRVIHPNEPVSMQSPLVYDLEVRETKVTGMSQGDLDEGRNEEYFKNMALHNAISSNQADLLFAPNYDVTITGKSINVKVTGFPANYRNFRNVTESDTLWLKLNYNLPRDSKPEFISMSQKKPKNYYYDISSSYNFPVGFGGDMKFGYGLGSSNRTYLVLHTGVNGAYEVGGVVSLNLGVLYHTANDALQIGVTAGSSACLSISTAFPRKGRHNLTAGGHFTYGFGNDNPVAGVTLGYRYKRI